MVGEISAYIAGNEYDAPRMMKQAITLPESLCVWASQILFFFFGKNLGKKNIYRRGSRPQKGAWLGGLYTSSWVKKKKMVEQTKTLTKVLKCTQNNLARLLPGRRWRQFLRFNNIGQIAVKDGKVKNKDENFPPRGCCCNKLVNISFKRRLVVNWK